MPRRFPAYLTQLGTFAAVAALAGCARQNYFQPDARLDAATVLAPAADSVRGVTAGRQYARHGRLYEALVGRHYRRTWAAPVTAPVFSLEQARPGGLVPGKLGGGFNSTSLGLTGADGQSYVLRTVDKDPGRATPPALRGTFLVNVLRDNVSSTQPYAALVVPPLAAAAGVAHTNPRLFYVRPDDAAFAADSLRNFRGQLALLEEKFSGRAVPVPTLGQVNVVSSRQAYAASFASPSQRIDQPTLLQARLFDALLGDWDRHPGQWNWATYPALSAAVKTYFPVPKDRDMVFYRLDDGVLGWLIGHLALRHWASFRARYPPAGALLSSGHYLDVRSLNGLSRADFRSAAQALQQRLPDTLLARALRRLRRLPPAAYALDGARTLHALRARREALPALADAYYRQLVRHVSLGGTAEAERFEIIRAADSTVVKIYSLADRNEAPYYQRTFFAAETRTIQLEGLGGDDEFVVTGGAGAGRPRLQLYGGEGRDAFSPKAGGRGMRYQAGSAPARRAYDAPPVE